MMSSLDTGDTNVLLQIQNGKRPDQLIALVVSDSRDYVETRGLKDYFNVKEIRITTQDIAEAMPEFAQVLSFLLETMSAAQELNLPYGYQNEFVFQDTKYSLREENGYRVLKRAE